MPYRCRAWRYAGLLFFGALLASRAGSPPYQIFDETHYLPAAKSLILLQSNLNWMHPPLGKLLLGLGWLLLTRLTGLVGDPASFRMVSIAFGLWALWGVRAWMRELGFSERASQAALWLTGFNFLWFVQSKCAMLDVFFTAFAVWGLLWIRSARFSAGWAMLGLAMCCKWAAAPYLPLAVLWCIPRERRADWADAKRALCGIAISGAAYLAPFLILASLQQDAVSPAGIARYHSRMLSGFRELAAAEHAYASRWWQWPTLARPIWYTFDAAGSTERSIFAGGNPILYWTVLPLLVVVAAAGLRRGNRAARALALLYWAPMAFWAVIPRTQMYYYYLPSSLWAGPILVWGARWVEQRTRLKTLGAPGNDVRLGPLAHWKGPLVLGFLLLCAATFFYFLPIMDGRPQPAGSYLRYMWLRSWI